MTAPLRLLVPFVIALVIGASAPAVAEDADTPVSDAAVQATPKPSAAPSAAPETEPTTEATVAPTDEPTTETTESEAADTAPETQPTATTPRQRTAKTPRIQAQATAAPTNPTEFLDALANCESGDTVRLGGDITISSRVSPACGSLTLDLAGHHLDVHGITIAKGNHLRIDDSTGGGRLSAVAATSGQPGISTSDASLAILGGTITATGGGGTAGIGGDAGDGSSGGNGGTIQITGGTVTATGGSTAAGIGGAGWGAGGTIQITGGTVTATGGSLGAGIGSGYNRSIQEISITGGTVFATAGAGGFAIGIGEQGTGNGAITIGYGANVTAVSSSGRVINAGNPGAVTINGTLRSASIDPSSRTLVVGSTGRILGLAGDEANGPVISGTGTIANEGVIRPTSVASTVKITGRHHLVSFDLNGGTGTADPVAVYAPTFAAAELSLPTPTKANRAFVGWTFDGNPFNASSDLGTRSTDGAPVDVELVANWGLTTANQLIAALTDCDDDVVSVDADITVGPRLAVNCDVTLDLNGHTVSTPGIDIGTAKTFTVDDSATGGELTANTDAFAAGIRTTDATLIIDGGAVRAKGGPWAAGIGGEYGFGAGTVTINGGTVNATSTSGGFGAAGIGGGWDGSGGTITINGGKVTAVGADNGPGIGGGTNGSVGTITINGGNVTASAEGTAGAGIGGAYRSTGGAVIITGGTVNATGAQWAPGIGSGYAPVAGISVELSGGLITATGGSEAPGVGDPEGAVAGTIEIGVAAEVTVEGGSGARSAIGYAGNTGVRAAIKLDGLVKVPSGTINTALNNLTVGSTGRLIGTTATPTTGASITGDGTVANGGVIALTNIAPSVHVTGHHYEVSGSTGAVKVYAPSVQAGYRSLPSSPTRGVDTFTGWLHGSDAFTATSPIPGSSADGTAVEINLSETWTEGSAAFDRSTATLTAGTSLLVGLSLTDGDGDSVATSAADWTITTHGEVSLHHTADGWELTGTSVGSGTVTASTVVSGRTYRAELDVTVNAAPLSRLMLSTTGTAAQGERITLTAHGTDAFQNNLGDVTGDVVFTSSITSDVVDGDEVSFTQAGPRTITATHTNGTTATILVTVAVVLSPVLEMDLSTTGTAAQGETITLTANGTDKFDNDLGDVTADVTFTSSITSDVVDGDEVSFTQAGDRTITATHTNGTTATVVVTVAVVLSPVTEMDLIHASGAEQGETITLTVTGTDRFGNDLGDVTADVTFTSSVSTDVISGNRITFPHASPHTITATHANGTKATLMVEVTPAAEPVEPVEPVDPADEKDAKDDVKEDETDLADTGSLTSPWWLASALALSLIGGGLLQRTRRR